MDEKSTNVTQNSTLDPKKRHEVDNKTDNSFIESMYTYLKINGVLIIIIILVLIGMCWELRHIDRYVNSCNEQWREQLSHYNCFIKTNMSLPGQNPLLTFNVSEVQT